MFSSIKSSATLATFVSIVAVALVAFLASFISRWRLRYHPKFNFPFGFLAEASGAFSSTTFSIKCSIIFLISSVSVSFKSCRSRFAFSFPVLRGTNGVASFSSIRSFLSFASICFSSKPEK